MKGPRGLVVLSVAAGLLLVGCSEGGGGGGSFGAAASTGDTTPPVVLADPGSGPHTYHTGGLVTLRGTALDDGTGVASVTVNGALAALGGSWTQATWEAQLALADGVNVIEVEATDVAGNRTSRWWNVFYAERYLDPAQDVADAAVVNVSRAGLAYLSRIAGSHLRVQDLVATALTNQTLRFTVLQTPIVFAIDRASFDPPRIDLQPTAAGLLGLVELTNVRIQTSGPELTADRILAQLLVHIDVANQTYRVTIPWVALTTSNLQLSGFVLPSGFLDPLLEGAIQAAVPPAIESALTGLSLSYSKDLLGVTFTGSGRPSAIVYTDGEIEIHLDGNLTSPSTGVGGAPGSPGGAASVFPAFDPSFHGHAAVHPAALNRALFAAWEAGLFERTIDQAQLSRWGIGLPILDARWFSLFFPPLNAMIGNPNGVSPVAIDVALLLPPSARVGPGSPNLELALGGLELTLSIDFGAGYTKVLKLLLSATLGADLTGRGDTLEVTLTPPPVVLVDVPPGGNPVGLDPQNIRNMLDFGLRSAGPLLGNLIPPIPVPGIPAAGTFPGIAIQRIAVGAQSPSFYTGSVGFR